MSGIEVAGLAIGIVPIIIEILKSYSNTKDRLKTFARHAQVVYDVHLSYRVAENQFSNDCELLLKAVVDDGHKLSEMVEDPKHGGWQNPLLEEHFRSFLGRDYDLCEEIVVRIRTILRETQARLSELDLNPNSTMLKRLHQSFNITLKENQYRRWLEELNQWNSKLGHLRTQRCKLQKQRRDCTIRKSVPSYYGDIHTASQRLHESLQESWSCTNVSHVGHQAKLSLNAKVEHKTAQLDIVIACRRRASIESQKIPMEAPIWLHIQSVTTKNSTQAPNIKPSALPNTLPSSTDALPSPNNTASGSVTQAVGRKLKKVRIDEKLDPDTTSPLPPSKVGGISKLSQHPLGLSLIMQDLKATKSICCYLSTACSSTIPKDKCLGYLETQQAPDFFKFIFFDAGQTAENQMVKSGARKESFPVITMLHKLKTLHQLTLAHKLAMATLQNYSTAWLPEDWNLHDISYFTDTDPPTEVNVTQNLQNLHLSTQFPPETSGALADSHQLRYLYGIRNLTLAKLGVALLEIGTNQDIDSLGVDVSPHRVITARKVILDNPPILARLGKNYVRIAQKCIDCDFSCGEGLSEESLRGAVYTDVVCALEDMIRGWKTFFDA